MTGEEAGRAVGILVAAFPRDSIEPETVDVWVTDIASLGRADAALAAAWTIARSADRFPTLREFRETYRQALDRFVVGTEILPPENVAPPDDGTREWFEKMRASDWQRVTKEMP